MLERHNERKNKNYSNKDIDHSKSCLNYHLKEIQAATYQQEFDRIRINENLKGNLRLHGEKQSTILCEFLITSDSEFFKNLGKERTKQFFNDAYDFVTTKVGGEQYVVSAVVHMDEKTPHMHVAFIPVINGKDRKGNPCKRINCSEFWKGKDSYARLQDEYYNFITSRGYDLERGVRGSTAEHLSVLDYKKQERENEVIRLENKIECTDNILKNREELLSDVEKHIDKLDDEYQEKKFTVSQIDEQISEKSIELTKTEEQLSDNKAVLAENANRVSEIKSIENIQMKKSLFGDSVTISQNDFSHISDLAKKQIAYEKKEKKLANEISDQKEKIAQLTEENSALKKENSSLKSIRNQINISALKNEIEEWKQKYQRVMDFIEGLGLKEKLEAFLKPKNRGIKR